MFKNLPVLVLCAALLALPAVASAQNPPSSVQDAAASAPNQIIEQILVKVNGEIITKTDLEARQVALLRQRGVQPKTDAELKKALLDVTPQLLVETVDEVLILQRGRDLGYKLSDEQFTEILGNIKKENKIETDEQFQAALKQEGLTLPELRKSIEKNMIINRVQQVEVMQRISVTDDEARRYYEVHKNELTTPSSMTVREFLVAVPNDGKTLNVGLDEDAKQKAEAFRERVAKGESFEKLATELSDSSSKANGGLVGPVSKEELDPALRKIFDGLKVGEVSPVARTSQGWQFFAIVSETPTKVLSFDEAREQISNRVANEKRRGEFLKYLAKLRGQALIEWKNTELKKMYDAAIQAQVNG
jgi:parvulin-like peptidyl-prolyl isomerase